MSSLMIWVENIAQNLVADLIFSMLLVVIGVIWYRSALTKVRWLFGFQNEPIQVYLPVIKHQDVFTENVVPVVEYEVANILREALRRQPNKLISYLMDLLGINSKALEVSVKSSPPDVIDVKLPPGNLILIGGPMTNNLTEYYLRENNPWVKFDIDSKKFLLRNAKDNLFESQEGSSELAVLEKIIADGKIIIVVFGYGELGTCAAVRYLAKEWRELAKEHKEKEFAYLLPIVGGRVNNEERIRVFPSS